MNRPLRIIHAADLHLDSPFQAMGGRAAQRRGEQRELLARICALAAQRAADMILLAGDLLDTDCPYAETGNALYDAFSSAPCPVFIAPGNHDYCSVTSPYVRMELPENVHVFKSGQMESVFLPERGVRIWGAAFTDIFSPPLLRGFTAPREEGVLNVGLLHGEVDRPGSRYDPISTQEIAASGLDYLALGHSHSCSGLRRAGTVYYAWPGCSEGRGFDECGEKGVLYAELQEDSCTIEFVPVALRKYQVLDFDISGGWSEVKIPSGASRDIYRLILTGETDAAPDVGKLYELLRSRFYSLQIVDRTKLKRDIWEGCAQDTLRGLFLRRMRARYDAADSESERDKITRAVRWGLAALDGGEAVDRI